MNSFWAVLHIDASTKLAADTSFASIAQKSGRKPDKDEGIDYLANVSRPWLLIIDNVDSSEVNIENYCPQSPTGCILITTRNPELGHFANSGVLQIDRMPAEDGKILLLKAANKPAQDEVYDTLATEIVERLDYLAMAIHQAGVAICEGHPMEEYLDTYSKTFLRAKEINGVQSWEIEESSLQRTFELLRKRLENMGTESSSRACEILDVAGMYHSQCIPRALFLDTSSSLWDPYTGLGQFGKFTSHAKSIVKGFLSVFEASSVSNPLQGYLGDFKDVKTSTEGYHDLVSVRKSLVLLNRFSLISFDRDLKSFSMHGVIHQWVRDRLGEDQRRIRQVAAAGLVNAIPAQPERSILHIDCRRCLLPHVAFFLSSSSFPSSILPPPLWDGDPEDSVSVRHLDQYQSYAAGKLALVFAENGLNPEAGALRREVLRGFERTHGRDDLQTLAAADSLAVILAKQSEYVKAEELNKRAIEGRQKRLGENHALVLESRSNLAITLTSKGEHRRAEKLHRQVLEKREEFISSASPSELVSIIDSANNLAICLNQQAKYGEAIALFQRTLRWREENLGTHHLDTIEALDNLAAAFHNEGSHGTAVGMYEDLLRRRRHVLGDMHPETLMNMSALAWTSLQNGDLEKAETLSEKACLALEAHVGRARSYAPIILGIYARIKSKRKQFQQAEELSYKALQAFQDEGVDLSNPDVLSLKLNLGLVFRKQNKLDDAEEVYRTVLDGYLQRPDQPNKDAMVCLGNLAVVLERKGRFEEAADLYLEGLRSFQVLLPNNHPQTLQCMENYARLLKEQKRYIESQEIYCKLFLARQERYRVPDATTARYVAELARLLDLQSQSQRAAAFELYQAAQDGFDATGTVNKYSRRCTQYLQDLKDGTNTKEDLPKEQAELVQTILVGLSRNNKVNPNDTLKHPRSSSYMLETDETEGPVLKRTKKD